MALRHFRDKNAWNASSSPDGRAGHSLRDIARVSQRDSLEMPPNEFSGIATVQGLIHAIPGGYRVFCRKNVQRSTLADGADFQMPEIARRRRGESIAQLRGSFLVNQSKNPANLARRFLLIQRLNDVASLPTFPRCPRESIHLRAPEASICLISPKRDPD
jgi:hypothetical protein